MAFRYHEYNGLLFSESDRLPVKHLFTGKMNEIGESPYAGTWPEEERGGDLLERVRARWVRLCEAGELPMGLCFTLQVHGRAVRPVTAADMVLPPLTELPPECDGLVTAERGVPLVVFTADCVPVLLCDPEAPVAAALHCGWKGTAKDMAGAGVEALLERGAKRERIRAAIGPAISVCCFETGPEVPEAMEALLGADAAGTWAPEEGVPGKYMVDLKEVNRRRLMQLGVPAENIDVSPDCTKCGSDRYWSHRATGGRRGTQASIITL